MFSFVSGRYSYAMLARVRYKNTCASVSRCLQIFLPFHEFRQALPVGLGVTLPVTAAVIFAKEFDLVVGDFHRWSLLSQIRERAKDVITSCSIPISPL